MEKMHVGMTVEGATVEPDHPRGHPLESWSALLDAVARGDHHEVHRITLGEEIADDIAAARAAHAAQSAPPQRPAARDGRADTHYSVSPLAPLRIGKLSK